MVACEVNPKRRHKLEENLKRLRLEVEAVGALTGDPIVNASRGGRDGTGEFSKVLVDDFTLDTTRESVPFESGHDGAFAARIIRS